MIAAMLAEVNRNPQRRSEPFTQRDFMPDRRGVRAAEAEHEMTVEETIAYVSLLNAALGGRDLREAS